MTAGPVTLITGGAQGLGLAYAQRLRQAGARVVVADVNETSLAALESAEASHPDAERIGSMARPTD